MSASHSTPTSSNRAIVVVIALIASLLVLVSPNLDSKADYTSVGNDEIIYNDRVCNLGDPNDHTTSATAFKISTSEQLWEITDCVSNSATIYFELGDDIDVSDASKAGTAPTNSPIGFSTSAVAYSFSGVLDGKNRTISGLDMSSSDYGVGLFNYLHDATISNLVIAGSFVTTIAFLGEGPAKNYAAGALAMGAAGTLNLVSISNQASVRGNKYVGGLVGYVDGDANISSSYNNGSVFGASDSVGGLVGYVDDNANINHSYNVGPVSGSGSVGGLVGNVGSANITSSSNSGAVSGSEDVGGLVGYVELDANITSSSNTGPVSGTGHRVGGLVGYVDDGDANIEYSYNTGDISGVDRVGGLVGRVDDDANINHSYNTGDISGEDRVGGLVGRVDDDANITSSYNTGPVSGSNWVGGLVGFVYANANINSSYNTGDISGEDRVGGLVGEVDDDAYIDYSYNTGDISGEDRVGGLVGEVDYYDANINHSYNTGLVTGNTDVDGLAGTVSGAVTTTSAYSSVTSRYVVTTPVEDMRLASTFVGFDNAVWGFGSATDNQGFPMLRVFAELSSYSGDFPSNSALNALAISEGTLSPNFAVGTTTYTASVQNFISSVTLTPTSADAGASITVQGIAVSSGNASGAISLAVGSTLVSILVTAADSTTTTYAITTTRADNEQNLDQTPAPIYSGPMIDQPKTVHQGSEVTFNGRRLETVTAAHVGGIEVSIRFTDGQSLVLVIANSMPPGTHDLVLRSSMGTLTFQNGITVLEAQTEVVAKAAPETENLQKLTVGSFKGFIAIYTKGYEGQRLSAKVAGKWLVIGSLDETWNGNNYSRTIRSTGAGEAITVHLYIDRQFVRTEELNTK